MNKKYSVKENDVKNAFEPCELTATKSGKTYDIKRGDGYRIILTFVGDNTACGFVWNNNRKLIETPVELWPQFCHRVNTAIEKHKKVNQDEKISIH